MKFHKEIKVRTGSYTNAQGEEKNSYTKIGALFMDQETGNMSAKLEVLPIPNSDGDIWLKFFDKFDENKQAQPQSTQQFGQAPQPQYNQQPQPQGVDPSMAPPAQPYGVPQAQPMQQNLDPNGIPY